jgi:DNA-binding SARP family transcriptional activator/tetratricopeptide (TPR) repeat protein
VRVGIALLGGFAVSIDGVTLPHDQWKRRQAAALVKLLALAPRGRLHRDRVVDALWPECGLDAALPRLHKAAHFARQALGSRDAVVLRDEVVALFPAADMDVDVTAFETAADAALRSGRASAAACPAAIALYRGELLPDDLNEPWSEEPRRRLRSRYVQLLRGAGRWPDLLRLDPADEQAHVESLREAVLAGDRAVALRRYAEMERILGDELGVTPGPEAVALRERVLSGQPLVTPPPTPGGPRPTAGGPRPGAVVGRGPAEGAGATPGGARIEETLLERDDDLTVLSRAARSVARTGRGAVVAVTGEAGSGKSSLVRAFLANLDEDMVVAVGGCDDLLAPRSLGPFRDMAETVPDVASALAGAAGPDDVLPALLRFLAAARTVLVVEDVHWADDATLDAIRYVSRRIAGVPALLLLTYREEDVDATHPLRRILGSLGGSSNRRIELAPLSVRAVRRLAGVDEAEAAELHRVTRGNPFFVTEVLAGGGDGVPATVRDAVLARVGRLPPAARGLAERIAVVPSRTERWLAESLARGEPDALLHAERSGVISGGPDHVAFRHELARRAIEASLTVGELVRANREVLDVLLQQPDVDPSRVVHHAVRALRTDALLRYGPIAAAHAQRAGAHRQAAQTLRVVLDHADRLDEATHASLLTQRAYSLYVVNEYEAALPCAQSAVSVAERSRDPIVLAEALMTLSRIVFFARGPMVARQAAERAVAILEGLSDDARTAAALIELARTHSNLATVGIVAQPSPDAVRWAERALALGDRLGRDDLRAQALCYLGSGRLALGDPRGTEDIERAIALGAAEPRLETRVRCYVNAAGSAHRAGQLHNAERYVAAGLRLAADGEFAAGQYRLHLTGAAVAASQGGWDHAIARLRVLIADPGRPGVMVLLARSVLARLLARRGDPEAGGVLDEALRDPVWTGDSHVAGPLAVAQVEVGWLTGTLDPVPPSVWGALTLAADSRHTAIQGELCAYLRRAGHDVAAPADAPGPWALALAGRRREAAAAWRALGERYEQALELVWSGEDRARATGLDILGDLGATATLARVR